ncbi:hypothetical protein DICSQDRAFT_133753 [Dichomitus squalens LYAD-421 SS1]|uniref:uncharacterized protein n=1 Tax=Dichomitus squalens (strain LYAD-421) TaxID=732165 RepID=UPI000441462D|nr:uncharacterized protein DICSQDRAFT_133753 [Dichomitus squalens LYAD-421 SS1]EJF64048.1 hypothetical protein DICSQDRAFT_133753 [Dichomitus squalens LYAD-421 SS1]
MAMEGPAMRHQGRLDEAHAATAGGGEEDEAFWEDGGALTPTAPTTKGLPGADDAALDVLAQGHAGLLLGHEGDSDGASSH